MSKPLCLHHRFRQNQAQSTNHTQFTANISQPKGNESNLQVARVSGGGYSRHSNISLGSGQATICGGGSCNPAKPKSTVRNRATTKPNQRSAHQSTPIQQPGNQSGAHLAERVVLLLEPLEAALLRHGKTLPPPTRRPHPPKP